MYICWFIYHIFQRENDNELLFSIVGLYHVFNSLTSKIPLEIIVYYRYSATDLCIYIHKFIFKIQRILKITKTYLDLQFVKLFSHVISLNSEESRQLSI